MLKSTRCLLVIGTLVFGWNASDGLASRTQQVDYQHVNGEWHGVLFTPPALIDGVFQPNNEHPCGRLQIPAIDLDQEVCSVFSDGNLHTFDWREVGPTPNVVTLGPFRLDPINYTQIDGNLATMTRSRTANVIAGVPSALEVRFDFGPNQYFYPPRHSFSDGDFNRDGAYDALDAQWMFAEWGDSEDADINLPSDGVVDAADAAVLFANWTGDAALVPEPGCSALTLASVVMLLLRRCR